MVTPGGGRMSAAMTNCGPLGWVSDRSGYCYSATDPDSGAPWPSMPESFRALAASAAEGAGFGEFAPDACLVNRYEPGAKMGLHQDKDELDLAAPIVSVSLGIPATFQFGGTTRDEKPQRVALAHGDVVVFGGASRLAYHGVMAVPDATHARTGRFRINLTFRRTGVVARP
jgi:alkylated DNA repair protein (DNA oxidative demethylase)